MLHGQMNLISIKRECCSPVTLIDVDQASLGGLIFSPPFFYPVAGLCQPVDPSLTPWLSVAKLWFRGSHRIHGDNLNIGLQQDSRLRDLTSHVLSGYGELQ